MEAPSPFTLAPELLTKPWGGSKLEPLLMIPSSGLRIGEAWILSDLASTSPSGAGGSAVESSISNGWGAGRSLRDLMASHSAEILGREANRFPLLLKLLEARRNLSVQVHPSKRYAEKNPGVHVKSEAWYALSCDPHSSFMVGVRGDPDPETLARLVRTEAIGSAMLQNVINPGDAVWIPSGTIHALGAGCLVFEVQTASDTTFRLYDWTQETGLPSRELHTVTALDATDFHVQPLWSRAASRRKTDIVFDTPAFLLATLGEGSHVLSLPYLLDGAVLLFPLSAGAMIESVSGSYQLPLCRVSVVPAVRDRSMVLRVPEGCSVLCVGVR